MLREANEIEGTWERVAAAAAAAAAKSLQSCPTLCDPIDSSPPGSPIPGILQARTLEWVAISFSNNLPAAAAKSLQLCPTLLLLEKQVFGQDVEKSQPCIV